MARIITSITGPTVREKYGCIATIQDENKKQFVIQTVGKDYIKQVVEICRNGSYKIICLSTPNTIYSDLVNVREFRPEYAMLARYKAVDLLV
jgi:hypothetical protein